MRLSYAEVRVLSRFLEDEVSHRVLNGPEIDPESLPALNRIRLRLSLYKARKANSERQETISTELI